jgi:hypothetical protein
MKSSQIAVALIIAALATGIAISAPQKQAQSSSDEVPARERPFVIGTPEHEQLLRNWPSRNYSPSSPQCVQLPLQDAKQCASLRGRYINDCGEIAVEARPPENEQFCKSYEASECPGSCRWNPEP